MRCLVALAVIAVASAITLRSTDLCATVPDAQNFSVEKYLGLWYEIEVTPYVFERNCFCTRANYTLGQSDVIVQNECHKGSKTGKLQSIIGSASVKDKADAARLEVEFFGALTKSPYIVLDTDYKQYALVLSCSGFLGDTMWILSRTPQLDGAVRDALVSKADALGLGEATKRLTVVDQSGCTY